MSNAKRRHRSRRRMNRTRAKFGARPGDVLCDVDGRRLLVTRVCEDWDEKSCTVFYARADGFRSHFHSTPERVALLRVCSNPAGVR